MAIEEMPLSNTTQELVEISSSLNPHNQQSNGRALVNFVSLRNKDMMWQDQSNCLGVDPNLFFPEQGASTKEAKAVCGCCEVRVDCLEYALVTVEKFGIWGGLSEKERRAIRSRRARIRRSQNKGSDTDSLAIAHTDIDEF